MKAGKAPGLSGIVVEMKRAASDMGASMIRDLTVAIIRDGKVPSDSIQGWNNSGPNQLRAKMIWNSLWCFICFSLYWYLP